MTSNGPRASAEAEGFLRGTHNPALLIDAREDDARDEADGRRLGRVVGSTNNLERVNTVFKDGLPCASAQIRDRGTAVSCGPRGRKVLMTGDARQGEGSHAAEGRT